MTPEQYITLYDKYTSGLCTPEEEILLLQYKDNFMMRGENELKLTADDRALRQHIYKNIDQTISTPAPLLSGLKWWIAAAAILALITTAGIIFFHPQAEQQNLANTVQHKTKPIKPGKNAAILTLSDGSDIILDDAANEILATTGNTSIKKIKNGVLSYFSDQTNTKVPANAKNTITIPRGGQYTVTLPDGTMVWLNSASSLTYPVAFKGAERMVTLKGEAYFEVAKNKQMPFIVQANDVQVKVLGTHFNVSAYEDEPDIKTTLLEGSVRLCMQKKSVLLVPGQQGTANSSTSQIESKKVNTDQVVAWKNGYFIFRDNNIREIMNQISRWYDVEIEYRGNMQNKNFGGIYAKNKDINELLKGLELTGLVHFKIEGRRIIVMS